MAEFNYHNRFFAGVTNSETGEVGADTIFHYRQDGDIVWATYAGGSIRFGTLVATMNADGYLDMRYQHVNQDGALCTGQCFSTPEVLPDGRYRLHERWQWTSGDLSAGSSVVEELNEVYAS
ncbi:MAG TPA: n-acetylglutamate synthase [Blastocatellia bacterium]|nr:n-acetylglutamate synthase [Blastocatellia bacterium]HMV85618.1 n-acetylglutamate synthase [Blastocatellia bacterium]HMX28416.1 n-acetylglutamate synthase [Blastocatellia bacterium]HMY71720.1 n-acetylglutamate synthase [Blastocatellia bacterium]HMZ21390.1 n-acetylglutamate synthase [Blastocatellia bacterium]